MVHYGSKPNYRSDRETTRNTTLSTNSLVVKALDSQSRGYMFKTTALLQGRLSRLSFWGR